MTAKTIKCLWVDDGTLHVVYVDGSKEAYPGIRFILGDAGVVQPLRSMITNGTVSTSATLHITRDLSK